MFTEQPKPDVPETPEVPPTPETPPVETPPVETPPEGGAADQSAEIKRLEKGNTEKDVLLKKNEKEIKQQRYVLGKKDRVIQKAKDEGFKTEEEPESGPSISEERVGEIVTEAVKPLNETIEKLTTTLGEVARANQNKPTDTPPGGSQNPPKPAKEPDLTPEIRATIKKHKLEWTGKGRIYKSPKTGRIYDYDATPDDKES